MTVTNYCYTYDLFCVKDDNISIDLSDCVMKKNEFLELFNNYGLRSITLLFNKSAVSIISAEYLYNSIDDPEFVTHSELTEYITVPFFVEGESSCLIGLKDEIPDTAISLEFSFEFMPVPKYEIFFDIAYCEREDFKPYNNRTISCYLGEERKPCKLFIYNGKINVFIQ